MGTERAHCPCRPAITTLIMQITQHLSNPNGNPQLALTFQPLVNMVSDGLHFQVHGAWHLQELAFIAFLGHLIC